MIVDRLGLLESLSTSRCYGISPSSYLILSSCPTLLYLNVFGLLRDPAMVELRQRLKGNFMATLNICLLILFQG